MGRWFAQGGGRRERTVLATKLYGDMGDWPNEGKLSALNIRRACDASLRRLQTDYVDLYQMHHVDRDTPWDEIWEAMEVLRHQGKILYVGSSNFAGWHLARPRRRRPARHFIGLVCEQSLYNLLRPGHRAGGAPGGRSTTGSGVIPWSPAPGRPARRGPGQGGGRGQPAPGRLRPAGPAPRAPRAGRARTRRCAPDLGEEPSAGGPGLAAQPARGDRPRSSGPGPWPSWTPPLRARGRHLDETDARRARRRSSRATSRPRGLRLVAVRARRRPGLQMVRTTLPAGCDRSR